MTIEINIKGEGSTKIKKIDVPTEKIIRGITHISVFSVIGREISRVRPPKRNVGSVFNWLAAAAISDALMNMAFPKENNEPEVVSEEKAEEVKDDEQGES